LADGVLFSQPFRTIKVSTREEKKMNSMQAKLMTLAATLAIAAANASAQTLKATVPFSFETSTGQVMQAGDYRINHREITWIFTNYDSRQQTLTQATAAAYSKPSEAPSLVFQCRANHCVLTKVVAGGDVGAEWRVPERSRSDAQELARIVVVPASVVAR